MILGVLQALVGLALLGVALAVWRRPVGVIFGWVFGAAFFGGLMYVVCYRRYIRTAVMEARPATEVVRESAGATARRPIRTWLILFVPLVILALLNPAGVVIWRQALAMRTVCA